MKTSLLLRQIALLFALCASGYAWALPPDLSKYKQNVEQNATYGLGEKIAISYVLEYPDTASRPNISVSLPGIDKIKGLKLIYGPSISTTTSYIRTKNEIKKSSKVSFQFLLKATEPGHYDLPDFVVTDNTSGSGIDFPPVHASFSVVNGNDNEQENKTTEKKTSLIAAFDNDRIRLDQTAILTLKLLSNEYISGISDLSELELDDSFISQTPISIITGETVEYEGDKYKEYIIGKYEITPLKSGEFTIAPFTVKCAIGTLDFFFSSTAPSEKTVTVTSHPLILTVDK